jgi:hypothetical protein
MKKYGGQIKVLANFSQTCDLTLRYPHIFS